VHKGGPGACEACVQGCVNSIVGVCALIHIALLGIYDDCKARAAAQQLSCMHRPAHAGLYVSLHAACLSGGLLQQVLQCSCW
jgi:hypothetical protein